MLDSLQAYRAIAALLVLFFHANLLCSDPRYFGFVPMPVFMAGAAGVPFFFVLSGFIIAQSHLLGKHGLEQAKAFLLKRALRLYPLLWLVLLAVLPLWLAAGHGHITPGYIISSFLALPTPLAPPLAVQWTLQHEIFFYAIFTLIVWVPASRYPLLGALALTSLYGAILVAPSYPLVFFIDPSHILFVAGVAILAAPATASRRVLATVFGLGSCLFAATYAFALSHGIRLLPPGIAWSYGIASCCIVWASTNLEKLGALRLSSRLARLGDASYVLYLIHFPLISIGLHIAEITHLTAPQNATPICLFLIAVAIATSLVVHEYLERRILAPLTKRVYRRFT